MEIMTPPSRNHDYATGRYHIQILCSIFLDDTSERYCYSAHSILLNKQSSIADSFLVSSIQKWSFSVEAAFIVKLKPIDEILYVLKFYMHLTMNCTAIVAFVICFNGISAVCDMK